MSGTRKTLDKTERDLRLEQLKVDIALKQQSLVLAPIQLFILSAGAVAALITTIFAGVKLFFGS